ncbi:hypothetical protein HP397_03765 [Streptobacillus felis]|uniref:Uncharacterized protein n=1 Tax=Streptobacillus felis TaxID=1384509 RepID=A0A7Z0TAE7_9FUSO|nr:hypothetical protein [Streptobacillus felis]NYV27937.1 hypothetical protein [Streptobacillus felis]
MEIEIVSYLADGSFNERKKGSIDLLSNQTTYINTESNIWGYEGFNYSFNTKGNRIYFYKDKSFIITIYKGNKVVYRGNGQ